MALPTLNFIYPEVGAIRKIESRLLKAEFGDGYTSVCGDGLNYQREVWTLTYPYMTRAQANTLWAFFHDTCGGGVTAFYYTVPGQTQQLKYTCENPEWTEKGAEYVTITAMIKQSFNLDT